MQATCGGCDTEWAGETKRAHCACCHHTFSTAASFDAHRWARGRGMGCYQPQDVGLTLHDGTWYFDTSTEGEE